MHMVPLPNFGVVMSSDDLKKMIYMYVWWTWWRDFFANRAISVCMCLRLMKFWVLSNSVSSAHAACICFAILFQVRTQRALVLVFLLISQKFVNIDIRNQILIIVDRSTLCMLTRLTTKNPCSPISFSCFRFCSIFSYLFF